MYGTYHWIDIGSRAEQWAKRFTGDFFEDKDEADKKAIKLSKPSLKVHVGIVDYSELEYAKKSQQFIRR